MTDPQTPPVLVAFRADTEMFTSQVLQRAEETPIAGTILIAAGSSPEHSITRLLPFMAPPVKGREKDPQFFSVACITRDLVLTLISLNKRFEMGLESALDLLAMTHPMVQQALESGSMDIEPVTPGTEPKRVVRDIIDVGAGGKGGGA